MLNMDALSQIFEDIHFKKTEYVYLQTKGNWSIQLNQQSAVMTYIALFGGMYLKLDNGEQVKLNMGDMLIIPSGMSHQAMSAEINPTQPLFIDDQFKGLRDDAIHLGDQQSPNKCLIFIIRSHIDSIMAGPLIGALPPFLHLKNALNAQEPEWLRIGLYFVADETKQNRPGRHKIMDHVVSIMLIESVRDFIEKKNQESATTDNNWLDALTHPELSHAISAIHSQPEISWTVESLAETCFMSRSKFADLFHRIVGTTPLVYLKQHRFRLATQLLTSGKLPIQQIAYKVGYTSETAFSQAFKKQYQCSPTRYRQNNGID